MRKDRAGIFSWIFPWLLVSLISYLFYNYVQNNNDPNSVKSLTGGARINRTVHLLDTSNNSRLPSLSRIFPLNQISNTEAYSVTNELKPGFLYTKLSSKMPEVAEPFP
uniref:ATP synthase F0 subunit 8 n=1 Tax=Ditylenchus dipsaci TaxID=166011 RepID=A0A915EKY6_9BILA